jgi:hypothetical protein
VSNSLSLRIALDGGPPIFLLYAVCVLNFKLPSLILLPVLLVVALPVTSDVQSGKRNIVAPESEAIVLDIKGPLPCTELQVTSVGAVCQSRFGMVARLDFPEVDLERALAGGEYLPQARAVFTADEKTVGDKDYRNIAFALRWQPATPEFLQIYLKEYIPYWGNQIPYRLFWDTRYEVCSMENCTDWVTVNEKGEFLPSDVKDLPGDLAADVNFNGVPSAFWNTKISQ